MYKLTNNNTVIKNGNTFIALIEGASGYNEYLLWLSQNNTPEPADPIPVSVISVSPWQMRKALNQLNLRDAVEAAVLSSSDMDLKDGWEFSTSITRNSPLVESMALALNKSESEVDDLFNLAKTL